MVIAKRPLESPGAEDTGLLDWVRDACGVAAVSLVSASEDASFRRYLRATDAAGTSWIVMDAPVAREDSRPFVRVAALLREAQLRSPRIVAMDLARGWLLLEDFGDVSYLDALRAAPDGPDRLYDAAIDALVAMQRRIPVETCHLPAFDADALATELSLFPDWFCRRLLDRPLASAERRAMQAEFDWLIARILDEPVTFVHRDYHSRNLMVPPHGRRPGIIDFQDAVTGPRSYDLVSLLKDCYYVLEPERRERYIDTFLEKRETAGLGIADRAAFRIAFRRSGIQRHLKVAGIFSRLNFRDGKARYLADLPLVLRYLDEALEHEPDLEFLRDFVASVELPAACHDGRR